MMITSVGARPVERAPINSSNMLEDDGWLGATYEDDLHSGEKKQQEEEEERPSKTRSMARRMSSAGDNCRQRRKELRKRQQQQKKLQQRRRHSCVALGYQEPEEDHDRHDPTVATPTTERRRRRPSLFSRRSSLKMISRRKSMENTSSAPTIPIIPAFKKKDVTTTGAVRTMKNKDTKKKRKQQQPHNPLLLPSNQNPNVEEPDPAAAGGLRSRIRAVRRNSMGKMSKAVQAIRRKAPQPEPDSPMRPPSVIITPVLDTTSTTPPLAPLTSSSALLRTSYSKQSISHNNLNSSRPRLGVKSLSGQYVGMAERNRLYSQSSHRKNLIRESLRNIQVENDDADTFMEEQDQTYWC